MVALALSAWSSGAPDPGTPPTPVAAAPADGAVVEAAASPARPFFFEANEGQYEAAVRFVARTPAYTLFLVDGGFVVDAGDGTRSFRFLGADPVRPEGEARAAVRVNHLTSGRWAEDVPTYQSVVHRGVAPGIDVRFRGAPEGRAAFDVHVAPGSDVDAFRLRVEGDVQVDAGGRLVDRGMVLLEPPTTFHADGRPVDSSFVVDGRGVGVDVGPHDAGLPLVVDPVLRFSTFLGGSTWESAEAIAMDDAGYLTVAGFTSSVDLPATDGQTAPGGGNDAFVAQYAPNGDLLWLTYYGGSDDEAAWDVAMDAAGHAYVAGDTKSADLPLAYPYDGARAGPVDGWFAKFGHKGSLLAASYLGGVGGDAVSGIDVLRNGTLYAALRTTDPSLPTWSAAQPSYAGAGDVYWIALRPDLVTPFRATYLGGSGSEEFPRIDAREDGGIVVAGRTWSADLPGRGPPQAVLAGQMDAFIASYAPDGSLQGSTYYGGGGKDFFFDLHATEAPTGPVAIVGETQSSDLPLLHPVDSASATAEGFVAVLDRGTWDWAFASYDGGSYARGVAVMPGKVHFSGSKYGAGLPLVAPLQGHASGYDGYVRTVEWTAAASTLVFSTYLGGCGGEHLAGMAVHDPGGPDETLVVTGFTSSADYPVWSAAQPGLASATGANAFVTHIATVPGSTAWTPCGSASGSPYDPGPAPPQTVLRAQATGHGSMTTPASSAFQVPVGTAVSFDVTLSTPGTHPIDPTATRWLRTSGGPSASSVGGTASFDPLTLASAGNRTVCATTVDTAGHPGTTACLDVAWEPAGANATPSPSPTPSPTPTPTVPSPPPIRPPPVQPEPERGPPPVDAGGDRHVEAGSRVVLDGSRSGWDGGVLHFTWEQVEGPTVALAGADGATQSFHAPAVPHGESVPLVFRLTVYDGRRYAEDEVVIHTKGPDHAPVANITAERSAMAGDAVMLDGSGSYDPDNDTLSYLWEQVEGPHVVLAGVHQDTATFEAPDVDRPTDLVFRLRVWDGGGLDGTMTFRMTVVPEGPPLSAAFDGASVPGAVRLTARATGLEYTWDLGDGSPPQHGRIVEHPFKPGRHDVTLTVQDAHGRTATDTAAFTVGHLGEPTPTETWGPATRPGQDGPVSSPARAAMHEAEVQATPAPPWSALLVALLLLLAFLPRRRGGPRQPSPATA